MALADLVEQSRVVVTDNFHIGEQGAECGFAGQDGFARGQAVPQGLWRWFLGEGVTAG